MQLDRKAIPALSALQDPPAHKAPKASPDQQAQLARKVQLATRERRGQRDRKAYKVLLGLQARQALKVQPATQERRDQLAHKASKGLPVQLAQRDRKALLVQRVQLVPRVESAQQDQPGRQD